MFWDSHSPQVSPISFRDTSTPFKLNQVLMVREYLGDYTTSIPQFRCLVLQPHLRTERDRSKGSGRPLFQAPCILLTHRFTLPGPKGHLPVDVHLVVLPVDWYPSHNCLPMAN